MMRLKTIGVMLVKLLRVLHVRDGNVRLTIDSVPLMRMVNESRLIFLVVLLLLPMLLGQVCCFLVDVLHVLRLRVVLLNLFLMMAALLGVLQLAAIVLMISEKLGVLQLIGVRTLSGMMMKRLGVWLTPLRWIFLTRVRGRRMNSLLEYVTRADESSSLRHGAGVFDILMVKTPGSGLVMFVALGLDLSDSL